MSMMIFDGWDEQEGDPLAAALYQVVALLGIEDNGVGGDAAVQVVDQTEGGVTIILSLEETSYTIQIDRTNDSMMNLRLSPRELQIAQLIAEGMPNKAIAAALKIKPDTVGTYMKRMYLKLNVNTRAEMVAKVIRGRIM
jgi:two-component system, NarL family, nitrate/nitrite response regulator NarL